MTETAADPQANDKRRRIVDAAWRLALRVGLRATTMEALAREAGVAKGTLYAHFPDKEAVFDGVVDDLLVELAAAFDRGMASDGAVAERIGAALAGKYGVVMRAIEGSPHAAEILDAHHRFAPRARGVRPQAWRTKSPPSSPEPASRSRRRWRGSSSARPAASPARSAAPTRPTARSAWSAAASSSPRFRRRQRNRRREHAPQFDPAQSSNAEAFASSPRVEAIGRR